MLRWIEFGTNNIYNKKECVGYLFVDDVQSGLWIVLRQKTNGSERLNL